MRWIIVALLIVHGLIHVGVATAPDPSRGENGAPFEFFTGEDRSWLMRALGISDSVSAWVAIVLIAIATLGFVISGVLLMLQSTMWREFAVFASVVSLLLILAYWNRYLPVGVAVNVGIVIAVAWANWPSEEMLGA
jgi:hypothetical protein